MIPTVRALAIRSLPDAERELAAVGINPSENVALKTMMVHHSLLVEKISCQEGLFIKQEMISLGGDAACPCGEDHSPVSGVILMGTEYQLRTLCRKLSSLKIMQELSERIELLLNRLVCPPGIWKLAGRTLSLEKPLIMGILNVTPDSFSDGNRFLDCSRAVDHALEMEAAGADIIDIGGESTRPFAPQVGEMEELARILPVVERLAPQLNVPISIDTSKASVAKSALLAGAEIINDISGLTFDENMASVVAAAGAGVVLMHTRGKPAEMQKDTSYEALISEISSALGSSLASATAAGIGAEHIVIDPGIGFGKSLAGNLQILRRLSEFSSLGRPILIGSSRKGFIGKILARDLDSRLMGTAATVAVALLNGASIFRVHDVREMRDVVDMAAAIVNEG